MSIRTIWATPNGDDLIAYMARVSNPAGQDSPETASRLIGYLIRNKHWSPFEMANLCVEVTTTRDIGRQLLRHWTLRPQEFSQRYQDVNVLETPPLRKARLQHPKNRQMSLPCQDEELIGWWYEAQEDVLKMTTDLYNKALASGMAKEQARAILPEGLTPTVMYFNGPVRSWLHFCDLRQKPGTQEETRLIAAECWTAIHEAFPNTAAAWELVKAERPPDVLPLQAAVELAERKFLEYAERHRAKGTPEGRAKAATNDALATYMRAALTEG